VQCLGGYAYAVPDRLLALLEVGDQVLLPGNAFHPEPIVATVERFGSNYDGPVKSVMALWGCARDQQPQRRRNA
jgi:hypothetical protein